MIYQKSMQQLCLTLYIMFVCTMGCAKRIAIPVHSPELETENLIHVELISGDVIKVKNPKILGQFIYGKTPVYETRPGPDKDVRIRLDKVVQIQAERFSTERTLLTLVGLGAGAGAFVYFVSQFENGFN